MEVNLEPLEHDEFYFVGYNGNLYVDAPAYEKPIEISAVKGADMGDKTIMIHLL